MCGGTQNSPAFMPVVLNIPRSVTAAFQNSLTTSSQSLSPVISYIFAAPWVNGMLAFAWQLVRLSLPSFSLRNRPASA